MSEFRPLFTTDPSAVLAPSAEPRSWFEVIESRFPSSGEDDRNTETGTFKDGVASALFDTISSVAEAESRRQRAGQPEPADIALLRTEALEEARGIVAQAQEQALGVLKASREDGYRIGYDAGYEAGEQDAVRHVEQRAEDERQAYQADINLFIETLEETSRSAWTEMEPEILALVFEIASRVIKMEVDLNRSAALEVVKNALRRVADSTSVRVRVHADDLETVRANREELYALIDGIRKVEIVEDRRVGPGGCIVETDAGTIDARIETQLAEIRKLICSGE